MRGTLAVTLLALMLAGCGTPTGPDFPFEAYNDSAEPVQVRVRATVEGEAVLDETRFVPPGDSLFAQLSGPPGDYVIEAWALGQHASAEVRLDRASGCIVYVANPDPVQVVCSP